jgi:hypothetical protein
LIELESVPRTTRGGICTWLEEAERELAAFGHEPLPAGQRPADGDGIGGARRCSVQKQNAEEQELYSTDGAGSTSCRHCSKRGKITS